MRRDTATLISWDEVSDALDEDPLLAALEQQRFVSRPGDLWLGATIMLGAGTVAGLCLIGALTVARWIWGIA